MDETSSTSGTFLDRLRTTSKRRLARMAGFYLAVLVFVFFWVLAFNFQLVAVFTGWFDPVLVDTTHYVHNVAGATWLWVWGLAMLVQLYRPARRVTAMQVALLLTITDAGLAAALSGFDPASWVFFFGPVFVAAALHPARGKLFRPRAISRKNVDPVLLGLFAVAVVPVALYVVGQLNFQLVLTDEHTELGHYGTMGYFGLSMLGLVGLATLGNRGRRFAVYGAAIMAIAFAAASLFQPTMSGLDATWSALTILWALAVVGAYEWSVVRRAATRARPVEESALTT